MATSLKSLLGGSGIPVGGVALFQDSDNSAVSPILDMDGAVFLKSGNTIQDQPSLYPDAFKFGSGSGAPLLQYAAGQLSNTSWSVSAYGNGIFVVLPSDGYSVSNTAVTSTDGANWTTCTLPISGDWRHLDFINGLFVAVPWGIDKILTSPDGVTWTVGTLPTSTAHQWNAAVYGGGKYIISQRSANTAAVSTDGITWAASGTLPGTLSWGAPVYGNGVFVMPYTGTTASSCAVSSDGTTWTGRGFGIGKQWRLPAFGAGVFVFLDQSGAVAVTSPDGITWTQRALPVTSSWSTLIYAGGQFVAIGQTQAMTSPDGINWTVHVFSGSNMWLSYLFYTGSYYIATTGNADDVAFVSPDGITWTQYTFPLPSRWKNVSSNGSIFVFPAAHIITSTTDFSTYNTKVYGIPWMDNTVALAYGNGTFVCVPERGDSAYSSTDGVAWTARVLDSTANNNDWMDVAYGAGLFVAIAGYGEQFISTSPDGITWTIRDALPAQSFTSITYGNGLFVAVASWTDQYATSPDGITWTARTLPANVGWNSIAYSGERFVIVGDTTSAAYSLDGITWTLSTLPTAGFWQMVAYGNGVFVAINQNGTVAATSPDGVTWTARVLPMDKYWRGLAHGSIGFIVVSNDADGGILSSTDGVTWTDTGLAINTAAIDALYADDRYWILSYEAGCVGTLLRDLNIGLTDKTLQGSAVQYMRIK